MLCCIKQSVHEICGLALILTTATPIIVTEPPADYDYCYDNASWQQWSNSLQTIPQDDSVSSLYAFRIGLYSMVRSGMIETEVA